MAKAPLVEINLNSDDLYTLVRLLPNSDLDLYVGEADEIAARLRMLIADGLDENIGVKLYKFPYDDPDFMVSGTKLVQCDLNGKEERNYG